MDKTKFDQIWKLLNDFEFKLDNCEFNCVICRSTLRNAHQSPCGCRYCLECVTKYLENANHCPGDTDECRGQQLAFESTLQVDYIANKRIATQSVQCPMPNCQFSSELRQIARHLDCSHSGEICPFSKIGCPTSRTGLSSVTRHLHSDGGGLEHARLLSGIVSGLQSGLERLSERFQSREKSSVDQLDRLAELEGRLDHVVAVQKEEMRILREQAERHEHENQILRAKLMELFAQETVTKVGSGNATPVDTKEEDNESIASVSEYSVYGGSMRVPRAVVHAPRYSPFRWVVSGFKRLLNSAKNGGSRFVVSDSFFSHTNGYRMCLTMHPNGAGIGKSSHVSVFVHLMGGPHDDRLEWPMQLDTRLCLVDAKFGNIYADSHFSYSTAKPDSQSSFLRPPKNSKNRGFGEPRLIDLVGLFNNSRIYDNDSIILRCFVGDRR